MTIEEWAKDFKGYVNALSMPRDDCNGIMEYIDDAVALLKEQEAKHVQNIGQLSNCESGLCPNCGNRLNTVCNKNFCGDCGQVVKWE